MTESKRHTRPRPIRTEPRRSWAQQLDGSPRSAEGGGSPGAGQPSGNQSGAGQPSGAQSRSAPAGDAAYNSVHNAYRLIDDYLRQGQRFAESVWLPFSEAEGGSSAGAGAGAPGRLLRAMTDMTNAWFELLQQSVEPGRRPDWEPLGTAGPFSAGVAQPKRAPEAAPTATSGASAASGASDASATSVAARPLRVRVESVGRVEVCFELADAACTAELIATELSALGEAVEPLRDVSISTSEADGPVLEVVVPAGHPPGVYNGLLLDRVTQRPRGTLSVAVLG